MPKKIIKSIAPIVVASVLLGMVFACIDSIEPLGIFESSWKAKLAIWIAFGAVLIWNARRIYVGYKDGTLFFDEPDDQ